MSKTKSITSQFSTDELFEIGLMIRTKMRDLENSITDPDQYVNEQITRSYISVLNEICVKTAEQMDELRTTSRYCNRKLTQSAVDSYNSKK